MGSSPVSRKIKSTQVFKKIENDNLVLKIFSYLHPHEIILIKLVNSYSNLLISDSLIWFAIINPNTSFKRLIKYDEKSKKIKIFYPSIGKRISYPILNLKLQIEKSSKFKIIIPIESLLFETSQHRLFFLGGKSFTNKKIVAKADFYEYKENSMICIEKSRMTYPRFNFKIVIFQDEIYSLGGEDNSFLTVSEKYLLSEDIWVSKACLPIPIKNGSTI